MLEGTTVNLRVVEKEDLPWLQEWWNTPAFSGIHNPLDEQQSKADVEKRYAQLGPERLWFLILTKEGSRIGFLGARKGAFGWQLGYVLIPSERRKGYGTEAVQLAVDYLFLAKDIVRVQAGTFVDNAASRRVLEKAGFQREGRIRKGLFAWGHWVDVDVYGLLREDWKKPRLLTKRAQTNDHQ